MSTVTEATLVAIQQAEAYYNEKYDVVELASSGTASNDDIFIVVLQASSGTSGTSGLLQLTYATSPARDNGLITLNGTPSNGTVEHALTFDGSLLHLTGSFKVNTVDLTYISESNSTTHTNYSSSNSTTFTNLSSSNSTTFTNLSSSNSTTFTNYSS